MTHDPQTTAWLDQEDARLAQVIRAHRWAVQYVGEGDEPGEPAFGYTIGLFGLGHPELVVVGLGHQKCHGVLDRVARAGDAAGEGLDAGTVGVLRDLMRSVVTEGTGTALKGVPGGPVHGKTGTAEFGNEDPPETHAWFTGYQGDVAFAVVVEGGGFGAEVAAPIAADFLERLAG